MKWPDDYIGPDSMMRWIIEKFQGFTDIGLLGISESIRAYYFYLTWAPLAASSQVIQDESRAKSGNYLAEFVCVVSSFIFSFIFLAPVRGKQGFQSCSAERKRKQILELPLSWSVYIIRN